MDNNETVSVQAAPEKKKSYSMAVRIIALVLVVLLIVSATNIDFSVVRYAGSDSMEAANYLLEHTDFLTENRYQRLVSLLTNYNAFDISLQAADSAIGKNDYKKAAKYLNKCLGMEEASAERPELYLRLGCVYMLGEKLPEAEAAFDSSIQLSPESADAYLLRAQVRVNSEDVAGANQDCIRYLSLGGNDPEMLGVAMSVAEYAGDFDTAIKAAGALEAQALNDNQRALYIAEQGRFLYLKGRDADAAKLIGQAKAMDAGALDGIHFAVLAVNEMNGEQYGPAASDFRAAGELGGEEAANYYEQAMVCAYMLGDNDLLADISREAQTAGTMSAQSWMLTGVERFIRQDYGPAAEAFDRCLAADAETAEAHYYRGISRMQLENYQGASEDFTQSIDRNEDTLDSYYNRGLCLLILEQYEQALADLVYVIDDGSDQELAQAAYSLLEPLIAE